MIRKLLLLFTRKEKTLALSIFLFVILGAVIEVTGLSLFAAFIGFFLDSNLEFYDWIIKNSLIDLETKSKSELITFFGVITAVVFALKNGYLLFINFILHKFIYDKYTKISTQLLRQYIEMPYINHLETNSAFLQRNVNTEVFWLFANILVPGITLLTEVIIVIVIAIALLYIKPISTMILMGGFAIVLYAIMFTIKRKMDALGIISQSYFGEMIKSVNQSLGGIKVTKVSGTQKHFLDIYNSNIQEYSQNTAKLKNVSQWPRYLVEVIIVFSVVIAALFMTRENTNMTVNLSVLSFFGMAAIRLMPSFNRITSSYTNIRYYSASLNVIFDELGKLNFSEGNKATKMIFNEKIEFQNVFFNYPGSKNHSVDNLSFKIKKGQTVAFIGNSGSGKTTIVDLICGLLKVNSGSIRVDGKNISKNIQGLRKLISYVPQEIYLLDESIRNNIAYGIKSKSIDDDLVKSVAKLAMIDDFIESLDSKYYEKIGENGVKMSGGQRQRLGIARALYSKPEILILDEGTAALDNKAQEYITNSISSLPDKITVITIAHRLDSIKNSDLILHIEDGKMKNEYTKSDFSKFNGDITQFFDQLNPHEK
jgi:ATP-binding cassette, subfamily B, bacterial PglK